MLVGGLLLGFGWALAGFCPGTGLVALGSGRKDALFFVLGGLVGAGLFTLMYSEFAGGKLLAPLLNGKSTLVTTATNSTALLDANWSPIAAIALALLMVLLAWSLPKRLS